MVKGTNRTVIEINDTGSNMFEKVIFFVTPEYGKMSGSKLKAEAQKLIDKYYPDLADSAKIRDIYKRRKFIKTFCLCLGVAIILTVSAILIF